MKVKHTAFGKTRWVEVKEFHNMVEGEEPEEHLWVERGEDYYALMSPQLKHKKVAIITREAWMNASD